MAWKNPQTWVAGNLVTANDLNTHLRDNLNYLHTGRPLEFKECISGPSGKYTTSVYQNFVAVDATNLAVTFALTSPRILVAYSGFMNADSSNLVEMQIALTGGATVNKRIAREFLTGDGRTVTGLVAVSSLPVNADNPTSYTATLQWRVSQGYSANLYSQTDIPIWLAVWEL